MIDAKLSTFALNAVRRSMPLDQWDKFADIIVNDRRERLRNFSKPDPDKSWFGCLDQLRSQGFVKLPSTLPRPTVDAITGYLKENPVYKGPHVFAFDGRARSFDEARVDYSMVGYRSDQVIRAPHVVDLFNDPRLIDLLEAYLGCVPTLYSLNAWWSFPANKPELIYSQYFHRDIDDWRFVTLFLYLTDVDDASGPTQVIPGTHTPAGMTALLQKAKSQGRKVEGFDAAGSFVSTMGEQYSEEVERLFGDQVANVVGPAGTMHLVNTVALHRGLMPTSKPRLIMWARYGLGPTCNSSDLEHGPLSKRLVPTFMADSPRNRFVNRLLFDFDVGPEY